VTPILTKLQKLIAHEQSARSVGNIAEAAAFASKIQELLLAHNLDMSDVKGAEHSQEDNVVGDDFVASTRKTRTGHSVWMENLASASARSMFCKFMIETRSNTYIFVGTKENRTAAIYMYNYLKATAEELNKKDLKAYREAHPGVYVNSALFRNGFVHGFTTAVRERLLENIARLQTSPEGFALVLRRTADVQKYVDLRSRGKAKSVVLTGSHVYGHAVEKGISAGKSVTLNRQQKILTGGN
jgi:hypothetical protein